MPEKALKSISDPIGNVISLSGDHSMSKYFKDIKR